MSDYLIHFNKNHSKANGQFVSGDGDGDGIVNDHANQKKTKGIFEPRYKVDTEEEARKANKASKSQIASGIALKAAGQATMFVSSVVNHTTDNETLKKAAKVAEFIGFYTNSAGTGLTVGGIINNARSNSALKKFGET